MQFTGTLLYNLEHHNRRVDICLEWIFAASSFKWFDPFSITLLNNHPEWVEEITIFELLFLAEESKSLTVDVVVNLITSYISVYSIHLFPSTECMFNYCCWNGIFRGSLRKTHLLQCRIQHMATDEVNIVFNIPSQTNPVSPPFETKSFRNSETHSFQLNAYNFELLTLEALRVFTFSTPWSCEN